MAKLKAFPFDAVDPLGGDHEFYAPTAAVDFVEGDTYQTLVDRVNSSRFADINEGLASGEISQEMYDAEIAYSTPIAGFWVVTERDCSLAEAVWPVSGCCTDSATYRCNSAAKRILKKAAIGEVCVSGYKPAVASDRD